MSSGAKSTNISRNHGWGIFAQLRFGEFSLRMDCDYYHDMFCHPGSTPPRPNRAAIRELQPSVRVRLPSVVGSCGRHIEAVVQCYVKKCERERLGFAWRCRSCTQSQAPKDQPLPGAWGRVTIYTLVAASTPLHKSLHRAWDLKQCSSTSEGKT